MYGSPWCGYCARARTLLADRGVSFEEIDVDAIAGAREEMIARSGGRRTVPQIFIDGRHIGGAEELQALDAAGGLDPLLK
jgi:glutaredoxin 3